MLGTKYLGAALKALKAGEAGKKLSQIGKVGKLGKFGKLGGILGAGTLFASNQVGKWADRGIKAFGMGVKVAMWIADKIFQAAGFVLNTLIGALSQGIRMGFGFMQSNLMGQA